MAITPPRPKGPPLTAMRAVEAAARLQGFSKAADELCVSPGAVAQQVRILEDWAGTALFERHAQGVTLTRVGKEILPTLTQAFDALGVATHAILNAANPNHLHLAVLPAIAQLWLGPRHGQLRAALPDITLSVTAMETPPNLEREPFDLSLFYGTAADGELLCKANLIPVCTPKLAEKLRQPQDLQNVPCLSDAVWSRDWALWMDQFPDMGNTSVKGPVFSLYSLAVDEALNGAGVLMGHDILVERELDNGRLCVPFGPAVPLDTGLVIAAPPQPPTAKIAQLIALLRESCRKSDFHHIPE